MTAKPTFRALVGAAFLFMAGASSAAAQDLTFGLTTDIGRGDVGAVVAYHGPPVFGGPGGVTGAWGVAARADTGGNSWVGAGFVLGFDMSDKAFVELSVMPGYYAPGDTELGGNFQIRSLIGLGWRMSDTGAIVLSLDHVSNAGTERFNPGAETVALGYRMSF